jgi:hypothetical protein
MDRRKVLALSAALLASAVIRPACAQTAPPPFTPEQLDQMLAPIALYPDALLSQILMAASYPLEVVEAARWSQANPRLKGQDAVNAVQGNDWDASVKSLVVFPDVLGQMNAHLDWTQKLGDAMIGQQADVADSIQRLRSEAAAAGNLQSGPQDTVTTLSTGDDVQYEIAPADPNLVYVPVYNPLWVYGRWRYAAYPPYRWQPLPGYVAPPASGFAWGVGLAAAALLFGAWTWRRGHSFVHVDYDRATAIDRRFVRGTAPDNAWRHDSAHRRGVAYRQPEARQQFRQPPPGEDRRVAYRGHEEPPPAPHAPPRPPSPTGSQHTNALSGTSRGAEVARDSQRGHAQQQRVASHVPPAPQRPPPPRPAAPHPEPHAEPQSRPPANKGGQHG